MKAMICIWGDPSGWDLVKYNIEEEKSENFKYSSKEYKSTLGALMELYDDVNILLFVASTLVKPNESFKNYSEIIDNVKSKINEYLNNKEYCIDPKRIELKVLPGIGRFKDKNTGKIINFIGNVNAFRIAASILSYEFISKVKPEILMLDISHGINYMPVYIRQSVYDAFNAYIALNEIKNARWIVYNSEPFNKGIKELRLNIVENIKINDLKAKNYLYNEFESLYSDKNFKAFKPDKGLSESIKNWRKLNELIIKFIKFSTMGQIIPLIEVMKDLTKIDHKKLVNELKKYSYIENCDDIVEIKSSNDITCVKYIYEPSYQTVLMIFIKNIVEKLFSNKITENEYKIDDLEEIANKFINEPGRALVENEISQIRDKVNLCNELKMELSKWIPYRAIMEVGENEIDFENKKVKLIKFYRDYKDGKISENTFKEIINREKDRIQKRFEKFMEIKNIDKRNFIAHSGLESNITLISLRNGGIYVKYSEEEKIQKQLKEMLDEIVE
jgi:CRISPR-associated protein Csx1